MCRDVELRPLVSQSEKYHNALALLETCHQIHAEAWTYAYAHNVFEGRHDGHLKAWAESLTEAQRGAIAAVRLTQRGWIVPSGEGVEISPAAWTDAVAFVCVGLSGLKRVEVQVLLGPWDCVVDESSLVAGKQQVTRRLQDLLREAHRDVDVRVCWRHRGS